jgi:hypothetical protein
MKNITLVSLALGLLASAPAALADDPGSKFCFGVDCPCGNDDPTGGCVNSSGHGAQLDASGVTRPFDQGVPFLPSSRSARSRSGRRAGSAARSVHSSAHETVRVE